jgi:hypothetical protein
MDSSPHGLLATYLNDHFAGATAGLELARRAAGQNDGSELGVLLARLVGEVEEDRETLAAVMDAVGAGRDRAKVAAAWVGEKAGRLKPNGQLTGYSPLSRLIELEGLSLGIEGKRGLWEALRTRSDARLGSFDFAALAERAARQRSEIEPFRLAAAESAFSEPAAATP